MDSRELQKLLNVWSKDKSKIENLAIDGILGPKTRDVIKAFQKAHDLVVDGIAGVNTKYELLFYKYNNFSKDEFRCNCDGKYCSGYPAFVDESLVAYLQNIRDHFKKPVIVTSGLRCWNYNNAVGGADNSQHLFGHAADIKVDGVGPAEVYTYADDINEEGCVIRYNTFNHFDRRGYRLRLDYRKI